MQMYRYLMDYLVTHGWHPDPIDMLKAVVAGREGTRVGLRKGRMRNRAHLRLDRKERVRAEVFAWLTEQGYDHHFSYEEARILGKAAHAVYLNLADEDAALYLRIRYNALPLEPGEVAHGEHGTWNVSVAE